MLTHNQLPLSAVSYDSSTFNDLKFYIRHYHGLDLHRTDPELFLSKSNSQFAYINLVNQDWSLRQKISGMLDNLERFSFVHPDSESPGTQIGQGVFIYPKVSLYPSAVIGNDVIIHSMSAVPHNTTIGIGTYISGKVVIGGNTQIGSWCYLGLDTTIFDGIKISDHIKIGACSVIKKNITKAGTWSTSYKKKLVNLNSDN
jgi:acetyltransferase-like isoleucine patch superfamily enzyme